MTAREQEEIAMLDKLAGSETGLPTGSDRNVLERLRRKGEADYDYHPGDFKKVWDITSKGLERREKARPFSPDKARAEGSPYQAICDNEDKRQGLPLLRDGDEGVAP